MPAADRPKLLVLASLMVLLAVLTKVPLVLLAVCGLAPLLEPPLPDESPELLLLELKSLLA